MRPELSRYLAGLSILLSLLVWTPEAFAADGPGPAPGVLERWEKAIGGHDRVTAVRAVYREATVQVAGYEGSIKAWHAAGGKYRKEEQIGPLSGIETFDGVNGLVWKGSGPPQPITGADLARAISSAYANWNSAFFVFFPERRRGNLKIEDDGTIVLQPQGGIDWRVTLDPKTSLPRRMEHQEGDRTITVDYVSWETIDGITFEKEAHRSNGDARFDAVIRFTKTVVNPPIDASLFAADPSKAAAR
jgi:hypothetical protein